MKTLTIRDDVYDRLVAIKRRDESFSELFERLAQHRGSLELLRSLRGSIEFGDAKDKEEFLREATSKRDERRA